MVLHYDRGEFGHRGQWLLLSRKKPQKVLYIFGKRKPSRQEFLRQEKRVQFFKHFGSSPKTSILKKDMDTFPPVKKGEIVEELEFPKHTNHLTRIELSGMKEPVYVEKKGKGKFFVERKHLGSSPTIVRVRSHKRRGTRGVHAHQRKIKKVGFIPKPDRRIFELMSTGLKKERGGYLDFGKGGRLEKFDVAVGTAEEVTLPEDYEAVFHTHPAHKRKTFVVLGSPSSEDMYMLIKSPKVQSSVIFHKGKAYAITKTPQSKKITKKFSSKKIRTRYDIDDEKELTKRLRSDGFAVTESKKGKQLRLPIKIIEPK